MEGCPAAGRTWPASYRRWHMRSHMSSPCSGGSSCTRPAWPTKHSSRVSPRRPAPPSVEARSGRACRRPGTASPSHSKRRCTPHALNVLGSRILEYPGSQELNFCQRACSLLALVWVLCTRCSFVGRFSQALCSVGTYHGLPRRHILYLCQHTQPHPPPLKNLPTMK